MNSTQSSNFKDFTFENFPFYLPGKQQFNTIFVPNPNVRILSEDEIDFYHNGQKLVVVHPEQGMEYINYQQEIEKCKTWNKLNPLIKKVFNELNQEKRFDFTAQILNKFDNLELNFEDIKKRLLTFV